MTKILTCKDCLYLTKKRGSMPKNRLCCNATYSYQGLFELECSPDSPICPEYSPKGSLIRSDAQDFEKTNQPIN